MAATEALATTGFPPPAGGSCDLLVVAGEHSGDQHAATAVRDLLAARPDLRVCALGGPALGEAGAQVLFDLPSLSVVGLVEVLRHYGSFRRLFAETLRWIEAYRPRVVCLVDYPGFNLRLARALRERGLSRRGGGEIRVLGYISPQIWAWKRKRRFRMQDWLDEIGTIFPFEVECYKDTHLPAFFLGHPFTDPRFRLQVHYHPDGPLLLLPGSRRAAVRRIFPALLGALRRARGFLGDRPVRVLYPDRPIREILEAALAGMPEDARPELVSVAEGSPAAAVLTSSGTMSLQCALAGIPGAIVYRAHPLTFAVGRRLVKIPYLGIANLLLDRPAYPEYLQGAAGSAELADEVARLLTPEAAREAAANAVDLRQTLSTNRYLDPAGWLLAHLDPPAAGSPVVELGPRPGV